MRGVPNVGASFFSFLWGGGVVGVTCVCLFIYPLFIRCHVSRHAPIKTLICLKYKQSLMRCFSLADVSVRLLGSVEPDD